MHYGRYVGHHNRHGSVLVLTPEGVKVGSSYLRLADGKDEKMAWQTEGWKELKGLPWDVVPRQRSGHKNAVAEAAPEAPAPLAAEVAAEPRQPLPAAVPEPKKKRGNMPVQRRYLEKYGYTPGCRGCNSIRYPERGSGQQEPHEDGCRTAMMEAILADPGASIAAKTQVELF